MDGAIEVRRLPAVCGHSKTRQINVLGEEDNLPPKCLDVLQGGGGNDLALPRCRRFVFSTRPLWQKAHETKNRPTTSGMKDCRNIGEGSLVVVGISLCEAMRRRSSPVAARPWPSRRLGRTPILAPSGCAHKQLPAHKVHPSKEFLQPGRFRQTLTGTLEFHPPALFLGAAGFFDDQRGPIGIFQVVGLAHQAGHRR